MFRFDFDCACVTLHFRLLGGCVGGLAFDMCVRVSSLLSASKDQDLGGLGHQNPQESLFFFLRFYRYSLSCRISYW